MTHEPDMLQEEMRSALVGAAAAAERRNRPMALAVFGAMAVAGAVAYLVWSVGSAAAAGDEHGTRQDEVARVEREVQLLLALAEQKRVLDERLRPDTGILASLEQMATDSGMLKPTISSTPESANPASGIYRTRFSAALNDQTAESIFRWLAAARTIEGLAVTIIDLSPDLQLLPTTEEGTARWQGRIEFARYEKK